LLNAPTWVLVVVNGVPFGVVMGLWWFLVEGSSATTAVVGGAVAGLAFGAVLGPVQRRQARQAEASLGALTDRRDRNAALRATWRGPVPDDPAIRSAAAELADEQHARLHRQRLWAPAVYATLTGLSAWLAVTGSPWWWCAVAFWIAAAVGTVLLRRRLGRRAELLRSAS
jgi:hypothetical protein